MGRALMIPGLVGENIGNWIKNNELPKTVSEFGKTEKEIFVCYSSLGRSARILNASGGFTPRKITAIVLLYKSVVSARGNFPRPSS